jgi:hypothetical protein
MSDTKDCVYAREGYCDGECLVCGRTGGKAQPPDTCGECRYHMAVHLDDGLCCLEPLATDRRVSATACRHGVRK